MQLARCTSLAKSNPISSVVKSASCSRGWVRLLVQSIFATFTVASFILIVLMTIPKAPPKPPADEVPSPGCSIQSCTVICRNLPFYGQHEGEILLAVTEAELHCKNVVLTLNSPMFTNNTMPPKWLSNLRTSIYELDIFGGNLVKIAPDAFMTQFTGGIQILVFSDLAIREWSTASFVGLSNLRKLFVKDSVIVSTPRDLLKAVDDTLEILTFIRSRHWDPSNITGITSFDTLTTVDFSSNDFRDILGQNSFTGLQKCKILYLNSCRITSIGAGAFDSLENIEMLFLNNNFLVTIPDGLFKNIILKNPKPRINLQENSWHCDCSNEDLRQLIRSDMLITDPVCKFPIEIEHKTFGEFEIHCINSEITKQNMPRLDSTNICDSTHITKRVEGTADNISRIYLMNNGCVTDNVTNSLFKLVSPVHGHACTNRNLRTQTLHKVFLTLNMMKKLETKMEINIVNEWITFSYFLKTLNYSMLQIGSSGLNNHGLVWYQSSCPHEVYCVDDVPSVLRIYSVDLSAKYIFCPVMLRSNAFNHDSCVMYDHALLDLEEDSTKFSFLFYVTTGLACLVFGAICVYVSILKFPNLLKGSKRILFVKHKTVDALVLPPKIPLRNGLESNSLSCSNEDKVFVIPANQFPPSNFKRNKSTRSSVSNTPSYISALQPTEDQLAEWRIQHHFDNNLSITSIKPDLTAVSWLYSDNLLHCSLDVDNDTYESLK